MLENMTIQDLMSLCKSIQDSNIRHFLSLLANQGQENEVIKYSEDDYYIVRTYSAGVFAGNIIERKGREVKMKNARRLWRWSGAASLSQLSQEGVKNPTECKFPCEIPHLELMEVIEIVKCSKKSEKSIKGVTIWTA